jgi:hypothetical protein
MGANSLDGAEQWARFHAGTPGCDRLGELLDEYDRRGKLIETLKLQVTRMRAEDGPLCRSCGRPVAPCPAYPDYPRTCLPVARPRGEDGQAAA